MVTKNLIMRPLSGIVQFLMKDISTNFSAFQKIKLSGAETISRSIRRRAGFLGIKVFLPTLPLPSLKWRGLPLIHRARNSTNRAPIQKIASTQHRNPLPCINGSCLIMHTPETELLTHILVLALHALHAMTWDLILSASRLTRIILKQKKKDTVIMFHSLI